MAIVKVHTADITPVQTSRGRHQSTRGLQNGLNIVSEEGESDDLKNNNDDDNEDRSEDESESKIDDSEDDNKDKDIDGNKGDNEDEKNFVDDEIENNGYEVEFVDDEVEDNQDTQNRQATYASSALNSDDRADSSSQYSSDEDSGNDDGVLVEELGYLNIV